MQQPTPRTVARISLYSLLTWMPVAWSQASPAFDCDKARAPVEQTICGNTDLAGKDRRLATLYAQALSDATTETKVSLRTAQRNWLKRRNACTSADCVSKAYEERLRELSTYTGKFDEPYLRAMCASFTTGGDHSQIVFESDARLIEGDPDSLDVNNDGQPELLHACFGGTMGLPCTEYKDAQGNELKIRPMGFDRDTYWTFGEAHFRYDGRTFIYHTYEDAGQPAYVSYVTPLNREHVLCDFDNKITNRISSGDAPVCSALERGQPVEAIALTPRPSDNYYAFERFETTLKAFGQLDIDNDGKPEDLFELQLSSGAARGCDWNYFELATPDGSALLKNEQSRLIHELQDMNEEKYGRRNCGKVSNRLLRHAGKVYYETNVLNATYHSHYVRILEGGRVATACTFDRNVATTIRSIKSAK